jgi:hypothetical protein
MRKTIQRLLILVVATIIVAAIGFEIQAKRKEQARKKREATYVLRLRSFTQDLTPGMTRKQVEDYLKSKNVEFRQMCCVEPEELATRSTWDDLTKIGEEPAPWFCSENNVYVAFQFTDHKQSDALYKEDDDLDTLRAVSIYRWLEGCL